MRQSGQSMLEYVLLLFLITASAAFALKWFKNNEFFFNNITKPLVAHIRYNYKYGDPVAQGWDEGEAKKHIQIRYPDGQNFRLFTPVEVK